MSFSLSRLELKAAHTNSSSDVGVSIVNEVFPRLGASSKVRVVVGTTSMLRTAYYCTVVVVIVAYI